MSASTQGQESTRGQAQPTRRAAGGPRLPRLHLRSPEGAGPGRAQGTTTKPVVDPQSLDLETYAEITEHLLSQEATRTAWLLGFLIGSALGDDTID
jgi:hypothetical protein